MTVSTVNCGMIAAYAVPLVGPFSEIVNCSAGFLTDCRKYSRSALTVVFFPPSPASTSISRGVVVNRL